MMELAFHPDAATEYRAAAEHYVAIQPELGMRFTFEVESAIARVLDAPERWPLIEQDVRRCLTHTFPYAVLYTSDAGRVLILAVMHCAREPGYWRGRASP